MSKQRKTAWRIKQATVYHLYRDDKPIVNSSGEPQTFDSSEEAQHVAANWDQYRAPSFHELRSMSTDDLLHRIETLSTHSSGATQ